MDEKVEKDEEKRLYMLLKLRILEKLFALLN